MKIISQIPANFAVDVPRNVFIKVQLDTAVNRATVNENTFIVVKTESQDIIQGVSDYVPGTKTLTFQFFEYLDKSTNYTVILVGGQSGIYQLVSNVPWSDESYVFSFTTGDLVDYTIPLAKRTVYPGAPDFRGTDGIYQQVFGKTGEPVTHAVTTGAQVGPSGVIIPAATGPDVYLPPEEPVEPFGIESITPENGSTNVEANEVIFDFNRNISPSGIIDKISVDSEHIFGHSLPDVDYTYTVTDDKITISPSGVIDLSSATNYTINLENIGNTVDDTVLNYILQFSTKLSPMYSTVESIRMLGSLILKKSDSDIKMLIYENSLWAYENVSSSFLIDEPTQAARDYVSCKTKLDLVSSIYLDGGPVTSKRLADFEVTRMGRFIGGIVSSVIKRLLICVEKNELILTTGTSIIGIKTPVRSQADSRMPVTEGSWQRLADKDF